MSRIRYELVDEQENFTKSNLCYNKCDTIVCLHANMETQLVEAICKKYQYLDALPDGYTMFGEEDWKNEVWGNLEKEMLLPHVKRPCFHEIFLAQAIIAASRSEDPSTNHGSVIVVNNRVVATGFNGTCEGLKGDFDLNDRTLKYKIFLHSEENAICNCDVSLRDKNAIIYITGKPCLRCFQLCYQKGIRNFILLERGGWKKDEEEKELKDKIVNSLPVSVGTCIVSDYLKPLVSQFLRFGGEKGK